MMAASGKSPSTPQFHFIASCLSNSPERTSLKLFLKQHQQLPEDPPRIGDEQQLIGAPHTSHWRGGFRHRPGGYWRRGVWYPALYPLLFPPPVVPVPIPAPAAVPFLPPPDMPPEAVYYDPAFGLPPGWILLENGWRVPYGVGYPRHLRVIRRAPRALVAEEQQPSPAKPAPPPADIGAESTPAYMENLLRMKKISDDMRLIRQASAKKAASPKP